MDLATRVDFDVVALAAERVFGELRLYIFAGVTLIVEELDDGGGGSSLLVGASGSAEVVAPRLTPLHPESPRQQSESERAKSGSDFILW